MGGILVAAVSTFLVLAMLTKVVTGEESLTYLGLTQRGSLLI
jgi:hypothetical protein